MIFSRHNQNLFPSTSSKAYRNKPTVDGIFKFATPGLTPIRCGYLDITEFPGNHTPIWFDIRFSDALGHKPADLVPPSWQRLQLHNTKCMQWFTKDLNKQI